MTVRLKYYFSCTFVLSVISLAAQPSVGNQAVVTIFGNSISENNADNGSNPYSQVSEPPAVQQQLVQAENTTIEPSLENGFHMRFEIPSSSPERMASGYASVGSGSSAGYGKVKKHSTSLSERSFNLKKKVKTWLPKRKKKYRPHLCGRF